MTNEAKMCPFLSCFAIKECNLNPIKYKILNNTVVYVVPK